MKRHILLFCVLMGTVFAQQVWAKGTPTPNKEQAEARYTKDRAICEDIHGPTAQTRVAACTRALAYQVKDARLWFYRAYAWDDLSDPQRAILDLGTAIKFNPDYADAFYNRGLAHFTLKNYALALADYTRVLELEPKDLDTLLNRGNVYYALKKYPEALADYEEILALDPEYPKALYNRALVWTDLAEYPKAIRDYTALIILLPNEIEHYLKRAWLYALQGEFNEAELDLNVALQIFPDAPNSLEALGWVYYLQGKVPEARTAFEKLWPQIEGPADWAAWIEQNQTTLLQGLTLSETERSELQQLLKLARESNDLAPLIAVYEKFLALRGTL